MTPVLLAASIALAGGLGAILRFVIDVSIPAETRAKYPWGTWIINISGSFMLGLVAGPLAATAWGKVVTIGLLGGYTTFSAASLETVTLAEDGRWKTALFYGFGTIALCTGAALLGMAITQQAVWWD